MLVIEALNLKSVAERTGNLKFISSTVSLEMTSIKKVWEDILEIKD